MSEINIELEVQLLAMLHGELGEYETSVLNERMANEPEVAELFEELKEIHAMTAKSIEHDDEAWAMEPERREKLLEELGAEPVTVEQVPAKSGEKASDEAGQPEIRSIAKDWVQWRAAMGIAACLVGTVAVGAILFPRMGVKMGKSAPALTSYMVSEEKSAAEDYRAYDESKGFTITKLDRPKEGIVWAGEDPEPEGEFTGGAPMPQEPGQMLDRSKDRRRGEEARVLDEKKEAIEKNNVSKKPSSPSGSSVITPNSNSPHGIPVPDMDVDTPSVYFGDGDDFGDGWGEGKGAPRGGGGQGGDRLTNNELSERSKKMLGGPADKELKRDTRNGGFEYNFNNPKSDMSDNQLGLSWLARQEIGRRKALVGDSDKSIVSAERSYLNRDYQGAVDQYKQALNFLPPGRAVAEKRKEIVSSLADASVALAKQKLREGDSEAARALVEDILKSDPENAKAKKQLAYLDDPIRTSPAVTKEYTKDVDKVRRKLYMAEGFKNLGQLDKAKEAYDDVLRIDKFNAAARRGIEKLEFDKADYYRSAFDESRARFLMEADKAWEIVPAPKVADGKKMVQTTFDVPSDLLEKLGESDGGAVVDAFGGEEEADPNGKDVKEVLTMLGVAFPEGADVDFNPATGKLYIKNHTGNVDVVKRVMADVEKGSKGKKLVASEDHGAIRLHKKLRNTVIPKVDFENATLETITEVLRLQSKEFDPAGGKKPLNFVVRKPVVHEDEGDRNQPLIVPKLQLNNVPLGEVLRQVCNLTHPRMRVKVEDHVIALVPATSISETELFQRSFVVPPNFAKQLATLRSKDGKQPSAQEVFQNVGIAFPEGAGASYIPASSTLVVRNTANNVIMIEELINKLDHSTTPSTDQFKQKLSYKEVGNKMFEARLQLSDKLIAELRKDIGSNPFSSIEKAKVNAMSMKEVFLQMGFPFPDGAKIEYDTATKELIVVNSAPNIAKLNRALTNARRGIGEKVIKKAPKVEVGQMTEELSAAEHTHSTFSLHVSDVSFKLAKAAMLEQRKMPERAKIRPEEFVNAFDYGDPSVSLRDKVGCVVEQAVHPFMQQRNLMRVSMSTAALGRQQPLRLTVLLDHSGSMEREDREKSVHKAMEVLAKQLGPNDEVTLISFAHRPRLLAERLKGDKAAQLLQLVKQAPSEGGTNIEEALKLAGQVALRTKQDGCMSRIVLLTDGAANLGEANARTLMQRVVALRQQGIAFDACGVGAEELDDEILEALSRKGDGRYYVLNKPEDADHGFAKQLAGALRPAASNVKVQVVFNPQRVGKYRLLGFEKHRLKKEDFRDDKVDAAEMAAEESGNAVYQFQPLSDTAGGRGDVGRVYVRFRDMSTGQMVERSWVIPYQEDAPRIENAKPSMQLATTAAMLAEKLRGTDAGLVHFSEMNGVMNSLLGSYHSDQRVKDLVNMCKIAK